MSASPRLAGKAVLVTGANRGIGRAMVEEALRRGASRVYAGTRQPWSHPHDHVTRLAMDVTNTVQIREAVAQVESLDVLINNAGSYSLHGDDFSDRSLLERYLAVNLFGPYDVIQAFLPLLARSRGAIVNVLSVASLAGVPFTPAYAISKAAAFSLTQSLRTTLAQRAVSVHAVFPGVVDTDMTRDLDMPKVSAESVARATFDGLEKGEEDILPDPLSASVAETWRSGEAKALERQFAAMATEVGRH
jgi:NAD(P)-dependent dehydrogenase (short-subunit alcohol dehydrogenase family)